MTILNHDVGLDVAMNHVVAMGEIKRATHFAREANGFVDRQPRCLTQAIAQGLPFYDRHHVVERAVGVAGVVQRKDVRMRQFGRELNLAQETRPAERLRKIRLTYFDLMLLLCLRSRAE